MANRYEKQIARSNRDIKILGDFRKDGFNSVDIEMSYEDALREVSKLPTSERKQKLRELKRNLRQRVWSRR